MSEILRWPDDLPAILRADTATFAERYADAAGSTACTSTLLAVFAKSPFVAEYAIRYPHEFVALLADPDLHLAKSNAAYAEVISAELAEISDNDAAKANLRRFRMREFVRIAWRDIALNVDVVTVMAELSACADALIVAALRWLHLTQWPRYGQALDPETGSPLELLVLAMGKLGGHELNFSSDIDLIFIYETGGTTVGGRRELSHQDYFDRIGRELIGLLNEPTADGFVFRVDMRLRPFGDSGPLTTSLGALEQYYVVHGRDWERYALIKARALSGGPRLINALQALVRPFVYRRYLDFGALDALRDMKAMIHREARTRQLEDDIKRGPGGIREIEFTAQCFQLTRGGREPRLRDRSLLATLTACADLGFLGADDVASLREAYHFLRTTEHRLQQVRDEQTHRLPADGIGRARLAYACGHADWEQFSAVLTAWRAATSARFQTLLAQGARAGEEPLALTCWQEVWAGTDDRESITTRLGTVGITLDAEALDVIIDLKAERFLSRLSRAGRARLDRLMPDLLAVVSSSNMSAAAFRRLSGLIRAIAQRSVYLAFLIDHPPALGRLVELFEVSPWIADQITRYPILLDELLDPRVLYAPPDRERLIEQVEQQVARAEDLESAMEALRGFKNQQVLRVAASDITSQFPVAEVSNQLTYIAEGCLQAALALAWRDLCARFGEPRCRDANGERAANFIVVGYGKLGGWELGYGSDLDLVFVHDSAGEQQQTNGVKVIENYVFFARLVQRLIHILSTVTASGAAYEIDTRLRPSGAAGPLVPSFEGLTAYLHNEAWTWEQQALVRARVVAGSAALGERFGELRRAVLSRERDPERLRADILDMRARMLAESDRGNTARFDLKHGRGGITDIEFMVQYATLRWAGEQPQLLIWTDNLRLLEIIAELGLWSADICRSLHDAYFAYRADIHRTTLQQADGLVDASRFEQHRSRVVAIWNSVLA